MLLYTNDCEGLTTSKETKTQLAFGRIAVLHFKNSFSIITWLWNHTWITLLKLFLAPRSVWSSVKMTDESYYRLFLFRFIKRFLPRSIKRLSVLRYSGARLTQKKNSHYVNETQTILTHPCTLSRSLRQLTGIWFRAQISHDQRQSEMWVKSTN